MFNATYFRYDGRWSGEFGLQIVDFDENNVVESEVVSLTPSLQKTAGSPRFFLSSNDLDDSPSCEFSVVSEIEIPAEMRGEILSWLIGRRTFRKLQFECGDNDDFAFYCIFTNASTIWISGRCHGFRLTAKFDSQFARGTPTEVVISAGRNISAQITNKTLIGDQYTYPTVKFTGSSLDIVNKTDDSTRHFRLAGIPSGETIIVDNETRTIKGNNSGAKLGYFTSKNWLRLLGGSNELLVTADGDVTITCPYYVMIGY